MSGPTRSKPFVRPGSHTSSPSTSAPFVNRPWAIFHHALEEPHEELRRQPLRPATVAQLRQGLGSAGSRARRRYQQYVSATHASGAGFGVSTGVGTLRGSVSADGPDGSTVGAPAGVVYVAGTKAVSVHTSSTAPRRRLTAAVPVRPRTPPNPSSSSTNIVYVAERQGHRRSEFIDTPPARQNHVTVGPPTGPDTITVDPPTDKIFVTTYGSRRPVDSGTDQSHRLDQVTSAASASSMARLRTHHRTCIWYEHHDQ